MMFFFKIHGESGIETNTGVVFGGELDCSGLIASLDDDGKKV